MPIGTSSKNTGSVRTQSQHMETLPSPDFPYLDYDESRRTESGTLKRALDATTSDPRGSACPNVAERCRIETQSLQTFAKQEGRIIEPYQFLHFLDERSVDSEHFKGGTEHDVTFDPDTNRVIKLTRPNQFGFYQTPGDYLQNLHRCNQFFDDDCRFEGLTDFTDGLQIVTSQPFVLGRKATDEEIANFFEDLMFERDGSTFVHRLKRIRVTDVKGKNVLIDGNGWVLPIDVHVEDLPV